MPDTATVNPAHARQTCLAHLRRATRDLHRSLDRLAVEAARHADAVAAGRYPGGAHSLAATATEAAEHAARRATYWEAAAMLGIPLEEINATLTLRGPDGS